MSFAAYGRLLRLPQVLSLTLIAFVARIPHAMTGVVLTLHVVTTLDKGYAAAGVAASAMTVGMAIGAPWRGRMVDRLGLRRAVLPSVVVESAVWIVAPQLSYPMLLGAAVVAGIFLVPVFSVVRQSLAVLVPAEQHKTAYAFDSVCTELVFMIGPVAGTFLATQVSTAAALVVVGSSTVVAGLALMWADPPTTSTSAQAPEWARVRAAEQAALAQAAGDPGDGPRGGPVLRPGLVVILASASVTALLLNGTDVSIVAVLEGWDRTGSVGWVVALWCLGSAIGGLLYGASRVELPPLVLVAIFGLLTLPAAFATSPALLAVLIVVSGLPCAATLSSINASLMRMVPEHKRGEVMGWSGTANTLGGAIGAPLCGAVIDAMSPQAGFAFAASLAMVLAGAGLAVLALLRRRRGAGAVREQAPEGAADPVEGA